MRSFLILSILLSSLSTFAADFTCQMGASGMIYLVGLESSPASISSIVLIDNTVPKDTVLTGIADVSEFVSIDFVNLETVSAFNFQVSKIEIESNQFVVNLFELGSPGSPSQNHILSCVKQ